MFRLLTDELEKRSGSLSANGWEGIEIDDSFLQGNNDDASIFGYSVPLPVIPSHSLLFSVISNNSYSFLVNLIDFPPF